MSRNGRRSEIDVLLVSARVAPAAAAQERLRSALQPDLDWEWLLQQAEKSRVSALLFCNLRTFASDLVPETVLARLRSRFEANAFQNLTLTGELFRLLRLFKSQGIRAVPYKGPTLAGLAYGNLALREFSDLDLLVDQVDLRRAEALLLSQGYQSGLELSENHRDAYLQSIGQLPYFHEHFGLVELHTRLTPENFGFALHPDKLWNHQQKVSLLGQELTTFANEELLLLLCAHAAKHAWNTLAAVVDIAELLRATPHWQTDRLLTLARELRAERMLQLGLCLASQLLEAPLPTELESLALDATVQRLATDLQSQLTGLRETPLSSWERARFHWNVREHWPDGARYCLGLVLAPTTADWTSIGLPRVLSFLYYLTRPLRLAGKYGQQWLRPTSAAPPNDSGLSARA